MAINKSAQKKHVTRGCVRCRLRKKKCNTGSPCDTCIKDQLECSWSVDADRRTRISWEMADTIVHHNQTLQARVRYLENLLESYGIEPSPDDRLDSQELFSFPVDDVDVLCTRYSWLMKLEGSDESTVVVYGGMSAFPAAPSTSAPPTPSVVYPMNPSTLFRSAWDYYLPEDIALSFEQHENLLATFFRYLSCWCLRVIPCLFRRDMERVLLAIANRQPKPKAQHYSGMLHNVILAVAIAFSDDVGLREMRPLFIERAKASMEDECRKPTFAVVQALSLLGTFYTGSGEHDLGFLYAGMSVRLTQLLGLGLECSPLVGPVKELTQEEKQERIWMFWATFAHDRCWSIYVGREASVRLPPFPIPLPDVHQWGGQDNDLFMAFKETVELFKLATQVMDDLYGNRQPDRTRITKIHVDLNKWYQELDPILKVQPKKTNAPPHTLLLNLAYYWVKILLRRPFYRVLPTEEGSKNEHDVFLQYAKDSRKQCDESAKRIVQLFCAWDRLYGLRFMPITPILFAFSAGTTFLLSARESHRESKPQAREKSLQGVEHCIAILMEMGKSWEAAIGRAETLETLMKTQLPHTSSPALPFDAQIFNEPSPQGLGHSLQPPNIGSWDPGILPCYEQVPFPGWPGQPSTSTVTESSWENYWTFFNTL